MLKLMALDPTLLTLVRLAISNYITNNLTLF
jgi:hypothetical protein